MQIKPIADPLPGESLLTVAPRLSLEPDVTWNRRLNLHSGRTLSDVALKNEQDERAGRLTLRGQFLSPGIISGLESGLEPAADAGSTPSAGMETIRVSPGIGQAASGEVLVVPQTLRAKVADLPVYAPVTVLNGAAMPGLGAEVARSLGPSLRELVALGRSLPRAFVVVLEPVEIETAGNNDPRDPCAVDAEDIAFADLLRVDGCRLILFAWPTEVTALPAPGATPTSAESHTWRNRIAYTIFEQERKMAAGQLWPWQELGLAVGLVAFDTNMQPQFVDRYSVVRAGGQARQRTQLLDATGSPQLWQARIQQFAEEVSAATAPGQAPLDVFTRFFFAPPVGLLPVSMLDIAKHKFAFFPLPFNVTARPIPLEQIDLAINESAPLAPFQDDQPTIVELLVPVPQQWYEPNLLKREEVAPEFDEAIKALIAIRAEWLARRMLIRRVAALLQQKLTGQLGTYPDPDPEALEPDEDVQKEPLDPREPIELFGMEIRGGVMGVSEFAHLLEWIGQTNLKPEEYNALGEIGLNRFISYLDQRIRQSDDIVDYSFLRVQTDIYRFRQRILGSEEAMRFATSPVLAAIAKGDSAYATRQDLDAFFTGVRADLPADQLSPQQSPIVLAHSVAPAAMATAAPEPASAPLPGVVSADLLVSGVVSEIGELSTAGRQAFGTTRLDVALESRSATLGAALVTQQVVVSPDVADAIKTTRTDEVGKLLDSGTVTLRPPSKSTILEQSPIVGQFYDFRTSVIGERMRLPPSGTAQVAAIATKYTAIQAAQTIPINVASVLVPGFVKEIKNNQLVVESRSLSSINQDVLNEILRGQHDPLLGDGRSDADYFNSGIKALENAVGMLRSLEGRIQYYRTVVEYCQQGAAKIQAFAAAADRRLKEIGDELAEARHDVAVARALRAEEQARIDKINARRTAILQSHVPFLCFRRPRTTLAVVDAPTRVIDAGFVEPVVTTCLHTDVTTPAEIQRLVDLMRRAPLRWFSEFGQLLDLLDRQQSLLAALEAARAAAVYRQMRVVPPYALPFLDETGYATAYRYSLYPNAAAVRVNDGLLRVFAAQEQVIAQRQAQIAALNLGDFAGLSWQNVRNRAHGVITIGDLIEANHGNSQVSQRAANALNDIAHVATCLYAEMCAVPALLRLAWAELLSEYDAPVGLRNLAKLPRWGEVPETRDRREMQSLVDWLFARINQEEPDAVGLVNDVVRVCILLASHAPVNQIIAGAVHEAVTVKPGGMIRITIDPAYVRIGMPVAIYRDQQVVARAVVADLIGGLAAAQVVTTLEPAVQVNKGARVQFGAVSAAPLLLGH